MDLVCTSCAAVYTSTRRSMDRVEEDATHLGWTTGWPKGRKLCPKCTVANDRKRTVQP